MVSVIISTVNRKLSLVRLLKNLSNQELLPEEVIVIEAGGLCWGEDDVPDRLQKRVTFIDRPNVSLSEARELGRKSSSGEILVFLDDDVIIETNYILEAVKFLKGHISQMAVGGVYQDEFMLQKKPWKIFIGKLLCIYEAGKANTILKSGWADYVREPFSDRKSNADWLFGCNWAIKASAFRHPDVRMETDLVRWSFLEDVIFGHRMRNAYGECMSIIPELAVIHDPSKSSGSLSPVTIRMRILYRYVFWRSELCPKNQGRRAPFCLGMIANTALMIMQSPSLITLYECLRSHIFILKNKPFTYREANQYIMK